MTAPAEATLQRVATAVAAVGIGVAAYIAIAQAGDGAAACFGGGGGCETVAESSHSELLGVNVALIGAGGYALLLVCAILRGDGPRLAGFTAALIGLGFSVYLTYLELFVINAICQWCVLSALLMTLLFGLSALRMVRYAGTPP